MQASRDPLKLPIAQAEKKPTGISHVQYQTVNCFQDCGVRVFQDV